MTANDQTQLTRRWRQTLQQGREALAQEYRSNRNARQYLIKHGQLVDSTIRSVWEMQRGMPPLYAMMPTFER